MTFMEIVEIITIILAAVIFGLMLYFKTKGSILGVVSELIAMAEKTGLTGSEKMAQVVDALYAKVPSWLKNVLNKDRLQDIAQWIFDWMRKYADTYAEKSKDDATEAELKETAIAVSTEAAAELISELMNAGLQELQEKAVEHGIITDGLKTKKEYIHAIILAVLNKA